MRTDGCYLLSPAGVHRARLRPKPCSDCFYAAEEEVRKCLDNAISAGDRNGCLETGGSARPVATINARPSGGETAITETQSTVSRPGVAPYYANGSRMAGLDHEAGLRRETTGPPYSLDIILADPQTLQIMVRHASNGSGTTAEKPMKAQGKRSGHGQKL